MLCSCISLWLVLDVQRTLITDRFAVVFYHPFVTSPVPPPRVPPPPPTPDGEEVCHAGDGHKCAASPGCWRSVWYCHWFWSPERQCKCHHRHQPGTLLYYLGSAPGCGGWSLWYGKGGGKGGVGIWHQSGVLPGILQQQAPETFSNLPDSPACLQQAIMQPMAESCPARELSLLCIDECSFQSTGPLWEPPSCQLWDTGGQARMSSRFVLPAGITYILP